MPAPTRVLLATLASVAVFGATLSVAPSAYAASVIEVTDETGLVAAITSASSGDTIRLADDIGTSGARVPAFTVSNTLTLDLNGHKLFAQGITLLYDSGIDFTIDDHSAGGEGVIDIHDEAAAFYSGTAITVSGAHLTIAGGTVKAKSSGPRSSAIGGQPRFEGVPPLGEDVLITGGTVIAEALGGAAIGGNENAISLLQYTVRITGGTVTATSVDGAGIGAALSNLARSNVFIEGGTVIARSTNGAGIR